MKTHRTTTLSGKISIQLFGLVLSFVVLMNTVGGYCVALQGVAWAKMLAQNAQHYSMKKSIERTFDGKHPCEICHKIANDRGDASKRPESFPTDSRSSEIYLSRTECTSRSFVSEIHVFTPQHGEPVQALNFAPPVPPPQFLV